MKTPSEFNVPGLEELIAGLYGIETSALRGKGRSESVSWARFVLYHCLSKQGRNARDLASRYRRTISAVTYGQRMVKYRMETERQFKHAMADVFRKAGIEP